MVFWGGCGGGRVNLYGLHGWFYAWALECDPYEWGALIIFWLRQICFSTGIHDTADTAAPVLQEGGFEQNICYGWILRERVVRQFDGLGGQFIGQMARILYLDAIVVDGDAYRTACIVKATMAQSIR